MRIEDIKQIIKEEQKLYVPKRVNYCKTIHQKRYMIWKYLACFRLAQFHKEQIEKGVLISRILYRYYQRKKNLLSEKTGVEIANHSVIGRRCDIWHGGVVINANIGADCVFHGNNILGNKGADGTDAIPTLGCGVDVGAGAVVIGNICIADNVVIGANAVVTKNVEKKGAVLVGVPAIAIK